MKKDLEKRDLSAKIIRTCGIVETVAPKNGSAFTLEELQNIVGGNIELLCLGSTGSVCVLNEVGNLIGLTANFKATELCKEFINQVIVGDVLYCNMSQLKTCT